MLAMHCLFSRTPFYLDSLRLAVNPDGNPACRRHNDGELRISVMLRMRAPILTLYWLGEATKLPLDCLLVPLMGSIVSGSEDHTGNIWDASTGVSLHTHNHANTMRAVAFSADGRIVREARDQTMISSGTA